MFVECFAIHFKFDFLCFLFHLFFLSNSLISYQARWLLGWLCFNFGEFLFLNWFNLVQKIQQNLALLNNPSMFFYSYELIILKISVYLKKKLVILSCWKWKCSYQLFLGRVRVKCQLAQSQRFCSDLQLFFLGFIFTHIFFFLLQPQIRIKQSCCKWKIYSKYIPLWKMRLSRVCDISVCRPTD